MRAVYNVSLPFWCGFEWTPWGWEPVLGDLVLAVIYDADWLRTRLAEMDEETLKMMLMMVFEFEEWYRMARERCDNLVCAIEMPVYRFLINRGVLKMAGVRFKETRFELCPGRETRIDAHWVEPISVVYDVTAERRIHLN